MSESLRIAMEVGFNILYLLSIWFIVILMFIRKNHVFSEGIDTARLLRWGFFLLALGDTGHVGFRVWAYGLGSLESTVSLGSYALPLVGAGALSTAITVTFFYMIIVLIWKRTNEKAPLWQLYAINGLFILRLIIMIFPQNEWGSVVPPSTWSLLRNAPLTLGGLWIALNLLAWGRKSNDMFQKKMGVWILVSYGFYIPVILFIQEIPMLGMLMIPKTLAYIAMAIISLRTFYYHERKVTL